MKVKIKDLEPNPYRDLNNYPMDENKVRSLTESIKQTGFWDNILARKNNDVYQIAYGHHRLKVIRELFKPNDEVDIPVKDLGDAMMIKIMANENMEDWRPSPAIIDETVRVAKQFLEEHPEEYKKVTPTGGNLDNIGFKTVAKFLSWPESRVSYSLERLHLIEDGKIDANAVKELETERAARNFVTQVKQFEIPKERQRSVVEKYKETGSGESAMRNAAIIETFSTPKVKLLRREETIKKIEGEFAGVDATAEDLRDGMRRLLQVCQEVGGTPEVWNGQNWRIRLMNTLSKTKSEIDKFLDEI